MIVANDTGFLLDADDAEVSAVAQQYFERHFPVDRLGDRGAPITDWDGFVDSGLLRVWEGEECAGWDQAWLLSGIAHEAGRALASATYVNNAIRAPMVWADAAVRAAIADSPELHERLSERPIFTAYAGEDPVLGGFFGDNRPDVFTGASLGMYGVFISDDDVLVTCPPRSLDEIPLFSDSAIWPGQIIDFARIPAERIVFRSAHRLSTTISTESLAISRLVSAAGLIGAADSALREVVEHVKRRQIFARTLSAFQSVKHQIAMADVGLVAARATVRAACEQRSASLANTAWRLSAGAATDALRAATQLHGGLGVSWEHSTHWFAKVVHREAWSRFRANSAETRVRDLHHLTEREQHRD